jgi:uncharacterized repeat protein (TIGR01451 family)
MSERCKLRILQAALAALVSGALGGAPVLADSDLSIELDNATEIVVDNWVTVYALRVENAGPDAASSVRVRDPRPAGLISTAWSCVASGGASCPAQGAGSFDVMLAQLPVGGRIEVLFAGIVDETASPGWLHNTAWLEWAGVDPDDTDHQAVDSDLIALFRDGLGD